jgi:general secretion pathway protein I
LNSSHRARGFTLVEVLVALMIVALGLTALMVAVNGTARTSGFLRDKTLAQWIALNRLSEVRLNVVKFGQNTDTGELDFGNRKWHYDTRYFDTSIASMKRVVVRVYLGEAKTKGSALAQAIGFTGGSLAAPGSYIADWTTGIVTAPAAGTPAPGSQQPGVTPPGAPIGPPPKPPALPPGAGPTTP